MSAIERLSAIEDIRVLKADYFLHVDGQNWQALRALFADDAETDFRESVQPHDPSLLLHDADAFVGNIAHVLAGVTTAHFGYMPRIAVDGDTAEAAWSMEDWLWVPPGSALPFSGTMHGWGHYHDRYRREDGRWRIAATRLTRVRLELS